MNKNNPFEIIANFGSDSDTFFLVGAPVCLLAAVALIFYVTIKIKRKNESKLLESDEQVSLEANKSKITSEDISIDASMAPNLPETLSKPSQSITPRETEEFDRTSWVQRLHKGLRKTRDHLNSGLAAIFSRADPLEGETIENLREVLFRADLGVSCTEKLVDHLVKEIRREAKSPSLNEVQSVLKAKICDILSSATSPLNFPTEGPAVVLVVGVNGVGKTTTVAKLASYYKESGKSVLLCAADTFRAAAIEQLETWSQRIDVPLIRHQASSDPAAVVFDSVKAAKARSADVLLIDTAGRLHNKTELMDELAKIHRVIGRELPGAPHEIWLVVDAVTGQNAIQQVKVFKEIVKLTGIVVTKLDGTAKGGVVIGISDSFQLPIRFIGVGEGLADLREFSPSQFSESIFGEGE